MQMGLLGGLELTAPEDLYITGELEKRANAPANHLQEKQALQALAARMADQPEDVLPHFVDLAMAMTGGVSAGLSLLEENPAPGVFRWRYLRGTLAQFEDATTPRNFSPCGITLDQNRPVLSLHPERFYDWISDASIVVPEVLLVPLYFGGAEPMGTLWIVAGTEGHFNSDHARIATELAGFVGTALRRLRSEQKLQAALEEQEILTREMAHRIKNLFAVAEGMVRITARAAGDKDDMARMLIGRFHALSSAHALVRRSFSTGEDSRVTDLEGLVKIIVEPHEHLERGAQSRFAIAGPTVLCGPHALNGVALIFHELATNAAKYGAVNGADGRIAVGWLQEGDALVVRWTEQGGPRIAGVPQMSGFGSKLLTDTVERQFRGTLAHDWRETGLDVTIHLPLKNLVQ